MVKRRTFSASGVFSGKVITTASTDVVDAYADIAHQFMSVVFDLAPGDYAISDESDVLDFLSIEIPDTSATWGKIEDTYGVTLSDVKSGRLVKIFAAIENRRRVQ
jgi:hypothetical protein